MHGNLGGAVTYFHKALQINPDYAEADKNPGIAFAQKENLNKAVSHLCETLWIRPDYKEAWYNLYVTLGQ